MCCLAPAIHPSSSAACFWTPYTILVRAVPFPNSEQAPEFWLPEEDCICGCHQRSGISVRFCQVDIPVDALDLI
jgi:hypothetical protein